MRHINQRGGEFPVRIDVGGLHGDAKKVEQRAAESFVANASAIGDLWTTG